MLYATVDPRSNMMQSSGCGKCCCEPVFMRPGEANLMTINYAPWSVPLMMGGGPGIVDCPSLTITKNSDTCMVGGPDAANLALTTPLGSPLDVEFAITPAGTETKLIELFGPSHGTVTDPAPVGDGKFLYTPIAGFQGYDSFYAQIKDAQGLTAIRYANIAIGVPTQPNTDPAFSGLQIQQSQAVISRQLQQLSFVMELSPDARECEIFTVNIKQPARDCERLFWHLTCIEVRVGKC